jgi:Cd2+/Zn2+-exporting ATPase
VFVAHASRVRGAIGIADQVRSDTAETVARLRELGVRRILMLTGDHPKVAAAVAAEVGISEVHAALLPEDKLTVIRQLQADGEVVAMVGDGVNDAPALAAADVGIAMGTTGTDVAMSTAEVAILSERLGRVADAITTARRTVTNLRQNVTIALVTVAVLLAGVFASAVQMAGGMLVHEISVLVVILNATRLFRVGRPAKSRRPAAPTQQETAWQGDGASR